MEFATISFEDIMKRLFKSKHDSRCFKKLANDHCRQQDIRPAIRKYEELRDRQTREEHLEALARACLRDSKYRDFQNFEEVILNSICTSDIPRRSFNEIFGHMEKETDSYLTMKKLLKRDPDFQSSKVKDTSSLGRIGEVRYADFTIVKEKRLGGHEIYSVDVKFTHDAFQTFLLQAHDFSLFSNYTWLVSTAGLVLDLGRKGGLRPLHALEHFKSACEKHKVGIKIFDVTARKLWDFAPSGRNNRVADGIRTRALQKLGFL